MTWRSLVAIVLLLAAILIPFFLWEADLFRLTENWLADDRNQAALAGMIVFLLALDVVLPTPSSLVSLAAAIHFRPEMATLWIFSGMSLGCVIGYGLGRLVPARRIFPDPSQLAKAQSLYRRYGALSLMLTRAVPVVAEASVIHAGITRVPMTVVMAFTLPANLIIGALYAGIGRWVLANPIFAAAIGTPLILGAVWGATQVGRRRSVRE